MKIIEIHIKRYVSDDCCTRLYYSENSLGKHFQNVRRESFQAANTQPYFAQAASAGPIFSGNI